MELPYERLKDICEKYKINLMILFGSYGTEKFNNKSDIDLAVICEDIKLLNKKKLAILNVLSSLFGNREIDLIVLNYSDALLKFNVAADGKLIYEKVEGLFQKLKVRAMSEHNDARKFYQLDKKYIDNFIRKSGNNDKQRVSPPQVK